MGICISMILQPCIGSDISNNPQTCIGISKTQITLYQPGISIGKDSWGHISIGEAYQFNTTRQNMS